MSAFAGAETNRPRELAAERRPIGNFRRAWIRFRSNRLAIWALALAILLSIFALSAPLIATYVSGMGPTDQELLAQFSGTSS